MSALRRRAHRPWGAAALRAECRGLKSGPRLETARPAASQTFAGIPKIQLPNQARAKILYFHIDATKHATQSIADRMRVLVSNYTARRRACRHFRRISDLNAEGLRDALRRSLRYLFEAMGRQLPAPLRTFSEVSAGRSANLPYADPARRACRHRCRSILLNHR